MKRSAHAATEEPRAEGSHPPQKQRPPAAQAHRQQPPPYKRKHIFRQVLHASLQDRLADFLGKHAGVDVVRITLGRIVGQGNQNDIVLPFRNTVLMDGDSHEFHPSVPDGAHDVIRNAMEAHLAHWRATPVPARRWAEFRKEVSTEAPDAIADAVLVTCPDGRWHFQLGAGAGPIRGVAAGTKNCPTDNGEKRRELRYFLRKGAGADHLWWRLRLCTTASAFETVEFEVGTQFLWEQHARMRAGKAHSFKVIVDTLYHNAAALTALLSEMERSEISPTRPCYYPKIFDIEKEAIRSHYEKKAIEARPSDELDKSATIRKYNNLIKVLLIEAVVDQWDRPVTVLDLGCGVGQDVNKYSHANRKVKVAKYVGVDFAAAAIEEAQNRHRTMLARARRNGHEDFPAYFYTADISRTETFDMLKRNGHDRFDVISLQFALGYLCESEAAAAALLHQIHQLLMPGGRIIGSLPNSDALAKLCGAMQDGAVVGRSGNDVYQVEFAPEAWPRLPKDPQSLADAFDTQWGLAYTFTMVGAVEGQREYVVPWCAFEEVAQNAGLEVLLEMPFPQMFQEYSVDSPFFNGQFGGAEAPRLSPDEEELFGFYTAFALERLEDDVVRENEAGSALKLSSVGEE